MSTENESNQGNPKAPEDLPIPEIRKLISSGKYKLVSSHRLETGSSPAWGTFFDVFDDNEKITSFVCCSMCKKVYHFVPSSGTTKLLRHQQNCLKASSGALQSNNDDGKLIYD